ncbi:hypothetical protein [Shewanella sp. Isolate8]|uniref:P-loop ATPase, Sll1717 family n=1 Tax=Shewanella sp. Isolate8 TaxID=2908529 RepID=UPI001EFEA24C|nr:hypothetical protein [Shewanella sp. Isolate8]MCG9745264.1 hypothetical protein [Shewanella sp. Isolate8]
MTLEQIVIKKGVKLGQLDAESDSSLLDNCFIDNGQLEDLLDVSKTESIIVGRTGAGKSAFVYHISKSVEHSVILDPHSISVQFVEHSNIIQFLNKLGIKLDLFYRMLWRHILIVELLKLRYELRSEDASANFIRRLYESVSRDQTKQRALNYFRDWGDKFWLETSEHLKEITNKLSQDLKSGLGSKFSSLDISLEGAKHLSDSVRTEVKSLATQVISQIQIQKLNEVFDLLSDYAFNDKQKKFYILIDKLDEDWAGTETRCRLIRALIEETKSFRNIPQVKIITALRVDLLDIVFDKTRDSGFQQDKYESYLVKISWSEQDLKNLIESRLREVYKRQYTSVDVGFSDVFPSPKHGQDALSYIIQRTLMRPRDVIQFVNECFFAALNTPRISWRSIHVAESTYSAKRLDSLKEEWHEIFPSLETTVEMLRGIVSPFTRTTLSNDKIEAIASDLAINSDDGNCDPCTVLAKRMYEAGQNLEVSDFMYESLLCLYQVGVIGAKISTLDSFSWSYKDQPKLKKSEIKRTNQMAVHRMVCHVLEISEKEILSLPRKQK